MGASICTLAPGLTNARASIDFMVSQRFLSDDTALYLCAPILYQALCCLCGWADTQGLGPALVRFGMCRCVIEATTQERCVLWRYLQKAVMDYISGTIRKAVPKKMKSELGFEGQTERCSRGEDMCVKERAIKQHDSQWWRDAPGSKGWKAGDAAGPALQTTPRHFHCIPYGCQGPLNVCKPRNKTDILKLRKECTGGSIKKLIMEKKKVWKQEDLLQIKGKGEEPRNKMVEEMDPKWQTWEILYHSIFHLRSKYNFLNAYILVYVCIST